MVIKLTKIFHCKTPQNFTQIGIFGLETKHLATLAVSWTDVAFYFMPGAGHHLLVPVAQESHLKNAVSII
jgi:hypothetical protein